MDQLGLSAFQFLMNLLEIPIKEGVLNGQASLIREHIQKMEVLIRNGVAIEKIIDQDHPDDLPFSPKRNGPKGIDGRTATEMLSHVASHL
jgi:hypothetical protein